MKDKVQQTIESLKEKVRANLLDIQQNQKEIRELLKQPVSDERSKKLEERYALNRVLLAENNDFINVQLTLANFIEKYGNTNIFTEILSEDKIIDEEGCFEMTINGQIEYNFKHPYFKNELFFNRLLDYYQNIEDYEKCSKLVNTRHKKLGLIG
jgi:hypothetical protein